MRKFVPLFAVLLAVLAMPASASAGGALSYPQCTAESPADLPAQVFGFTYEKFTLWTDRWPTYLTGCAWMRLPQKASYIMSINFQKRIAGNWVGLGCPVVGSQSTSLVEKGLTTRTLRNDISRECAQSQAQKAGYKLRLVVTYQVAGTSPLPQQKRVITPISRGYIDPPPAEY